METDVAEFCRDLSKCGNEEPFCGNDAVAVLSAAKGNPSATSFKSIPHDSTRASILGMSVIHIKGKGSRFVHSVS